MASDYLKRRLGENREQRSNGSFKIGSERDREPVGTCLPSPDIFGENEHVASEFVSRHISRVISHKSAEQSRAGRFEGPSVYCTKAVFNLSPTADRSSVFSKESSEARPSAQEEVQVLGAGLSVVGEFLQTRLGAVEEPGASLRLEGTSCQRYTSSH